MRLKLIVLIVAAMLEPVLYAQESVCDLFSHLTSEAESNLVVTGELVVSRKLTVLGSRDCDRVYVSNSTVRPIALALNPSSALSSSQIRSFQDAKGQIERLRQEGKSFRASATLSGRLRLASREWIAAELIFDSFKNFQIENLPDPASIRVVPICDLFRDLAAYKGELIAVRGEFTTTMEGQWIVGRCQGGFVTDGYRWPVALNVGRPADCSPETTAVCDAKWPAQWPRNEQYMISGYSDGATTATFVGTLRMRSEYHVVCMQNGWYVGNGYGHLNGAVAELTVDNVLAPEATPERPKDALVSNDSKRCTPK
jgi:hypothetical protein